MFLRSKTILVESKKKSRSRGKATRKLGDVDVFAVSGPPKDGVDRVHGFKLTRPDGSSYADSTFSYEEGKTYTLPNPPAVMCDRGYHYCSKALECLTFVNFRRDSILWHVWAKDIQYSQTCEDGAVQWVTDDIHAERKCSREEQDAELTGWTDVLDTYYHKGMNAGGYCPGKRLAWSSSGTKRRDVSLEEATNFLSEHIAKVEAELARGSKYFMPSEYQYGQWVAQDPLVGCHYHTTHTSAYLRNFFIFYRSRTTDTRLSCSSIEEADEFYALYVAKKRTAELNTNNAAKA